MILSRVNGGPLATLEGSLDEVLTFFVNLQSTTVVCRLKVDKQEMASCDIDDVISHVHPQAHKRLFITVPGLKTNQVERWAERINIQLKRRKEEKNKGDG